jgi:hypothetical protein
MVQKEILDYFYEQNLFEKFFKHLEYRGIAEILNRMISFKAFMVVMNDNYMSQRTEIF